MKEEKIYDAITQVDDKLIEEARTVKLRKTPKSWRKWIAIAACAALVLGLGPQLFKSASLFGGSSGGGGHVEGSTFMSYAGPVFPLTLSETEEGLTATRQIDFDFSTYTPREEDHTTSSGKTVTYTRWESEVVVTDDYILTNATDQDISVTAIYPYAASLAESEYLLPEVSVDGSLIQTTLNAGPYTGSFTGAFGDYSEEGRTLNLAYIQSWEGYKALLSDRLYMERAFDEFTKLDQKVVVYEFSDISADHEAAVNPTMNIEFSMDYSKTRVFSYGFNGGSMDSGKNYRANHFSVPQEFNPGFEMPRYLIVIGEDIEDYVLQGYENGGCHEGEELDSVTASVTRYESTLEEALRDAMNQHNMHYGSDDENTEADFITDDVVYGLSVEMLLDYGLLSDNTMDRYDFGALEDIFSEASSVDRVFYLSFDVTVPAGERVTVQANMIKDHSYDYDVSGSENEDVDGYDMVTRLGSNLIFEELTASVQDHGLIDIVRQNFGFDLDNGIRSVVLKPTEEHYYMEIKPKDNSND